MTIFPPTGNPLFESVGWIDSVPFYVYFRKADDVEVIGADRFTEETVFDVTIVFW